MAEAAFRGLKNVLYDDKPGKPDEFSRYVSTDEKTIEKFYQHQSAAAKYLAQQRSPTRRERHTESEEKISPTSYAEFTWKTDSFLPRKISKTVKEAREQEDALPSPYEAVKCFLCGIQSPEAEIESDSSQRKVATLLCEDESLRIIKKYQIRDEDSWTMILKRVWQTLDIVAKAGEVKTLLKNDEDPFSEFYTEGHFKNVSMPKEVGKALIELRFRHLSTFQAVTLKTFHGYHENVIAEAPPVSGKTTVLILACLKIVDYKRHRIQAVIINFREDDAVKTFNMAKRITKYFRKATFHLAINSTQNEAVEPHIIIGTPSAILSPVDRHRFDLKNVVVLAIDDVQNASKRECDYVLTLTFMMNHSLSIIAFSNPGYTTDAPVMEMMDNIVRKYLHLKISPKKYIIHCRLKCHDEREKEIFIEKVYKVIAVGKTKFVIFCKNPVELSERMPILRNAACVLSEDLSQEERTQKLDDFRLKSQKICVFTTSSCLLNVVGQFVGAVVNFDLPLDNDRLMDMKEYFARTGMIEFVGIVINLTKLEDKMAMKRVKECIGYKPLAF